MEKITIEQLKNIELLKQIPDNQLQWLLEACTHAEYEAGERLFNANDLMNRTFIIIKGRFRICILQNGKLREVADIGEGAITGHLPFSRGTVAPGYGECTRSIVCLECSAEKIKEMTTLHYELTEAMVHVMTTRVREYTSMMQQNEKMVALGKLSAGLAHELNNPAAAIARDASSLKEQLRRLPLVFKKIAAIKMNATEIAPVNLKIAEILSRPEREDITMMERSAREDDITDWLADHDINDYEVAGTLADFDFTLTDLDDLREQVSVACLAPVLAWINNNLLTDKIVTDIQESSRRISELVGSVKNFTHMDQSTDKQFVNIHMGIKNTLKMLEYKLRKANIEFVKEFDFELPEAKVYPGALNQVWTNIIDNAIDAMEPNGSGILRISTAKDGNFIKIRIIDNGPGIPDDIKTRIFDPFFSTKEMGKGTGLGLDVVTRIIRQHNGTVKVNSVPGNTEFEVCIPIDND
ncbi:ATP-binding protein [Mucilaginibacter gynuensis]|uniref:histidine kinase n=1 Tax=Mucilaginibacter gynuensis TaxID=1302236 RepID=A0ABP8G2E7_9SPHI